MFVSKTLPYDICLITVSAVYAGADVAEHWIDRTANAYAARETSHDEGVSLPIPGICSCHDARVV